jgi:hypothetical protein
MPGFVPGIHVLAIRKKDVDGRDIGEPAGLALGKPKGELRDAVLRTAIGERSDAVLRTAMARP